jgi:hypothetical protein
MDRCFAGPGLVIIATVLLSADAEAQRIANIDTLPTLAARLDPQAGETTVPCEVEPIRPTLNFGFRFQAGYVFREPPSAYEGAGHRWIVLMRVTPEQNGSTPAYLIASGRFPAVPQHTRARAESGGSFWLGEGRYSVRWLLQDDQGRVCRKSWRIDAALGHGERNVKLTIPPNTVTEVSWRGFSKTDNRADSPTVSRMTVLLDAAPRRVRRNSPPSLSFADQLQLLGAFAELLHRLPAASVRLVVFNLDRQKEVFHRDDFHIEDLNQVAESLNALRLGLVESSVLQDPTGRPKLLATILNREIHDPDPSSMVIFLGPEERYSDKVAAEFLDDVPAPGPRFFYLQCRPTPVLTSVQAFDMSQGGNISNSLAMLTPPAPNYTANSNVIQSAMKRLQGETLTIYTPGQFAKAVEHIREAAARP